YVDDMYGPRTDALNSGVPTDRVIAEWELSAPARTNASLANPLDLPPLIETAARPDGLRTTTRVAVPDASGHSLEIPHDIAGLRSLEPTLAEQWRKAVREALTHAFDAGYRASGFARLETPHGTRAFYLLDRS